MRALGVDLGTVRIGLAVSAGGVAVPAATLHVTAEGADWPTAVATQVDQAASERQCDVVVVGLPRGMSGRDTASTQRVRNAARAMEEYGRKVVLFDERLSSAEAERALLQAGRSGRQRRREVDQMAATIILQAWLDTQEAATLNARRED